MALPDWLKLPDILKVTATQAFALTVACPAIIYLSKRGLVPPLEPWMELAAAFGGIFGGVLFVAILGGKTLTLLGLQTRWTRWQRKVARRKAVKDYIPHMNDEERQIIGYLLERNQKSFDCALDGGYAVTLIARGIVVRAIQAGQVVNQEHVPMIIPDDVWEVLSSHRASFPAQYKGEAHPWRINWMAR